MGEVQHNYNEQRNNLPYVNHSFHVKWVKCAKDFRKIEGQQIRQVVSLTERCIIEGEKPKFGQHIFYL